MSALFTSNVIKTFTFLKYDWSRLDIIADVHQGKKGGREREREREGERERERERQQDQELL